MCRSSGRFQRPYLAPFVGLVHVLLAYMRDLDLSVVWITIWCTIVYLDDILDMQHAHVLNGVHNLCRVPLGISTVSDLEVVIPIAKYNCEKM